jgi:hypothetical protein
MMRTTRSRPAQLAASTCLVVLCLAEMASAHAWSLTISGSGRRLFLHVGNGTTSNASGGFDGPSGSGGRINLVSVTVPMDQIGNGTAIPMFSDSSQATSLYGDNRNTCPDPTERMMIGAGYRRNSNAPGNATLSVSSIGGLSNGTDTIPFTEIGWDVSVPGSPNPDVIPAGNFNGATQNLATVPGNTYLETCHVFRYANRAVRAAGTYNGRVTYTLSSP